MTALHTLGLFVVTAVAEIVGCYLPYLWLKKSASPWVLLPAAASLALFAWLLSLHPTAAGRVYAEESRHCHRHKVQLDDLFKPPLSSLNGAGIMIELFGEQGLQEIVADLNKSVFAKAV
jgi:hypothetical protein